MPFNMNAGYGKMIASSLAARRPHTGKVFFVAGSTDPNWEELTEMFPPGPEGKTRVWSTLSDFLSSGIVTDGGDDVCFVAPGYEETITAAAGFDTGTTAAGLTIIGLGYGDARPLISFSTSAGADFDIGSNGVVLDNLRFDLTGVDALTGPIDVNDSGCTIRNCEFITADSGGQAVVAIVTDANADDLLIENCRFIGSSNAGTTSAIRIVGGDNITIRNNYFDGSYKITAGAIEVTTTAAAVLLIEGNSIKNNTAASTTAINLKNGTTGTIVNNRFNILSGTAPIKLNEGAGGAGGSILVGGNYYHAVTTVVAGTLL